MNFLEMIQIKSDFIKGIDKRFHFIEHLKSGDYILQRDIISLRAGDDEYTDIANSWKLAESKRVCVKVDVLLVEPCKFSEAKIDEFFLRNQKVYKLVAKTNDTVILEDIYNENLIKTETRYGTQRIVASTITIEAGRYDDIWRGSDVIVGRQIPLSNLTDVLNYARDKELIYRFIEENLNTEIVFTEVFKGIDDIQGLGFVPIEACEIDSNIQCGDPE